MGDGHGGAPAERSPALTAALERVAVHEAGRRVTVLNKVMQRLGPTKPFIAVYRRLGPKIDPWLQRRTGGRIATRVYGFPALLLATTGAKTGKRRTSPLFYVRDGDDFVVVGTNFGTEHHPAWTANLLAHPDDAVVEVGTERLAVDASLADPDAFARIWPRFSAIYGGYDTYLERLTERTPRMFVLTPVDR